MQQIVLLTCPIGLWRTSGESDLRARGKTGFDFRFYELLSFGFLSVVYEVGGSDDLFLK